MMYLFILNSDVKVLTKRFNRSIDDGEILNLLYNDISYEYGFRIGEEKVSREIFTKGLSSKFNLDIQQLRCENIMLQLKVEKMRYGIKLVVVSVSEKQRQITLERLKYIEYNLSMFSLASDEAVKILESHTIIGLTESESNEFKEAVKQVLKYQNSIKKILNINNI